MVKGNLVYLFVRETSSVELLLAYTCHGGWYENGASFVVTTPVTRDSTAARRYCFVSHESRGATLTVTRSASNCERINTEPEPLVFDATSIGKLTKTISCHSTDNEASSVTPYKRGIAACVYT